MLPREPHHQSNYEIGNYFFNWTDYEARADLEWFEISCYISGM